jgi:hypothetical protein
MIKHKSTCSKKNCRLLYWWIMYIANLPLSQDSILLSVHYSNIKYCGVPPGSPLLVNGYASNSSFVGNNWKFMQ